MYSRHVPESSQPLGHWATITKTPSRCVVTFGGMLAVLLVMLVLTEPTGPLPGWIRWVALLLWVVGFQVISDRWRRADRAHPSA